MRLSMGRIFILEGVMKQINEHYYTITNDEITSDMEYVEDGLYLIGEDFYEVCDNTMAGNEHVSKDIKLQQMHIKRTVSTQSGKSHSNLTMYFVLSILFLAFSVLCFYLSTVNFITFGEINDIKNQLEDILETVINFQSTDKFRDGFLWLFGGIASIVIGIVLSVSYNKKR